MLVSPSVLYAAPVTVDATGEYIMGDNDTFIEAKNLALQDAKRLILEKIGTYIESSTQVEDHTVTKDDIKIYTAGIVKVEYIEDKRQILDNKMTVCNVTVRATVDPDDVVKKIYALKSSKALEESARKLAHENESLQNEINQLNNQLRQIMNENQYKQLRVQREIVLSRLDENEKGRTLLLSSTALLDASLRDKKKQSDAIEMIKTHVREIADAYSISIKGPFVEDNGDNTSNIRLDVDIYLPGQYQYKDDARISVSSMAYIRSLGINISSSHGNSLNYSCKDDNNKWCNNTLLPAILDEFRYLSLNATLGPYKKNETLSSGYDQCRDINTNKIYNRDHCIWCARAGCRPGIGFVRITHPICYSRSYQFTFSRIPYESIKNISSAVVKVVFDDKLLKMEKQQERIANTQKAREQLRSAQLHVDLNLLNDALNFYGLAIESDPSYSQAFYERSLVLEKIGKNEEALKDKVQAAKLGHADAQKYLRENLNPWH
jgi:hypothetical protein